jgi:hypothetical protein
MTKDYYDKMCVACRQRFDREVESLRYVCNSLACARVFGTTECKRQYCPCACHQRPAVV